MRSVEQPFRVGRGGWRIGLDELGPQAVAGELLFSRRIARLRSVEQPVGGELLFSRSIGGSGSVEQAVLGRVGTGEDRAALRGATFFEGERPEQSHER